MISNNRLPAAERSIASAFEEAALRYAQHIAIRSETETLSYDALNRAANRVAHAILALRGPASEPVAFILDQGVAPPAALLGSLKAGKFYVALDPAQPVARLKVICAEAQPVLMLCSTRTLAPARELAGAHCALLNLDELAPGLPEDNPGLPTPPQQLSCVIFTSGSTGQPKGVVYSQRSILYRGLGRVSNMHITARDVQVVYQSWGTTWAMTILLSTLLSGGTLCVLDVQAMGFARLSEWLIQHAVTIFPLTPSLMRQWLAALPNPDERRFPALRLLWTGGEGLHLSDVALWKQHFPPGAQLGNSLSMTETGLIGFVLFDRQTPVPAEGTPLRYTNDEHELLIVREDGSRAAPGETGEIAVRSHYMMSGYWRNPQLTTARLRPDPEGSDARVYYSGDLGRLGADGKLEVLGRRDYQVKVRGFLVQPAEIEQALLSMPGIAQAAVTAHDDPAGGKRLAAYLVARDAQPSVARVRAALASAVPEYMVPAVFIFMDTLPLTAIGKVDRRALPLPSLGRPPLDEVYIHPRSEVEAQLAAAWAQILGVSPVGVRDNFFDLGGDSLRGARVVAEVERLFGKRLAPAVLLEAPTIERLAAQIQSAQPLARRPAFIMLKAAARATPALFCLPWANDGVYALAELAARLSVDLPVLALLSAADGGPNPHQRLEDEAAHYVRELCAAQPEGPCYLLGWSYGAYAAFETAQQLHTRGRRVAFLGILDSGFRLNAARARLAYGGRRVRYLLGLGPRAQVARLTQRARRLASVGSLSAAARAGTLQGMSASAPAGALQGVSAPAPAGTLPGMNASAPADTPQAARGPAGAPPPVEPAYQHVALESARNRQRLAAYTPRAYAGRVSLFRTADRDPHRCRDPYYDWGYIAKGGLESFLVPGDHSSMLAAPHVSVLAARVSAALARAMAQDG